MKPKPWYKIDATPQEIGLQGIANIGHHQMLPRTMVRMLGDAEAIMLSFLMNFGKGFARPRNRGWFYCTRKVIQNELGYLKDKQIRIINKLVEEGVLATKIKKKGFKTERHFRINYDLIYRRSIEIIKQIRTQKTFPNNDEVFDDDES